MRKYWLSTLILFSIVLFSGCSLSSPSSDQTTTLSESLWKSTDGGKNWTALNKATGEVSATDLDVLNLVINPYNSQEIYVGLKIGGILKSEDGGETWQATSFTSEKVYGLDMDPNDGRIIYATSVTSGRGKIWKSANAETDWEELYTMPTVGPLAISLTVDKINPQNIYITTTDNAGGNEVLKSSDGGISWKNIFSDSSAILKVAIDNADNNLVYLLLMDGIVMRSQDGGVNFEDISDNFSDLSGSRTFVTVETDPAQTKLVYLAGGGGMLKSQDGGNTWKKIVVLNNPETSPVSALAINSQNSQEIVYGASQAAYKSLDGGVNWSTSQFDVKKTVSILKYDPSNSGTIYLGFKK